MQRAVLLFTKVPEPRRVKTRLIGANGLSAVGVSDLYSAILLDVFDIIIRLTHSLAVRTYVCYAPQGEGARIRKQLHAAGTTNTSFFPQKKEAPTAQRIALAFDTAFGEGSDIAVLVFGDQPELDEGLLLNAFQALETAADRKEQRLVLGPTCDGGTYLIGLTSGLASWLHKSIDCTNTSKAVSKLVLKAKTSKLPTTLLSERMDLDDPDDLAILKNEQLNDHPRTNALLRTLPPGASQDVGDKISVIIPTLNEERTLERTILSIRAQRCSSEVIVVDGGSSDETLQIANRLADRVIVASKAGRQHQENVGAKGAKGSILLFLHGDTMLPPTFLQSITTSFQDQTVVAGGAHLIYSPPDRFRYRALCVFRDLVTETLGISGMGSSFFVRKHIFHGLGGFDEMMNEEAVDMCKRLRGLGKHVMLKEVVQTSARRYESSGFMRTIFAWAFTVVLSYVGIRAVPIEKYVWRVVR
jgi:glycosyltransferase A (GT-A) superfamily protein (DUF2064 family)